jgi:hypothetical protein
MVGGHGASRLARLAQAAVARVRLDLTGRVVLTEAATGAYAATPVLAALAGAEVLAVTRSTRYGSVEDVRSETAAVAGRLGVTSAITVLESMPIEQLHRIDVVTNSGHLRPLSAPLISELRSDAVVPLMFEAWEVDAGRHDVDLDVLRARGIRFAGTNERHPDVDVFSFLGVMAVRALHEASFPAYRTEVGLLCDNPFMTYLECGLSGVGAGVRSAGSFRELLARPSDPGAKDPEVVLIAMTPTGQPVLDETETAELAGRWPDSVVVQFWGDLDRSSLHRHGLMVWPGTPPSAGHMAVLPSAVGPEPVVRLQAGGLKVAEVLLKPPGRRSAEEMEYLDEL